MSERVLRIPYRVESARVVHPPEQHMPATTRISSPSGVLFETRTVIALPIAVKTTPIVEKSTPQAGVVQTEHPALSLTSREIAYLELFAKGLIYMEIAQQLKSTVPAIKNCLSRARSRNALTTTALILRSSEQGLLKLSDYTNNELEPFRRGLTIRQKELLDALTFSSEGLLSDTKLAEILGVEINTITRHFTNIATRLDMEGVFSRVEVGFKYLEAKRRGIV